MKLKKDINLLEFFQAVHRCRQDVFFYSSEGDQLNLKSMLSQYMFSAVFNDKALIGQGKIVFANQDDYSSLRTFLEK